MPPSVSTSPDPVTATVTPGAGFIGPVGALIYGAVAAVICFYAINVVKKTMGIDDSLDVFAVHGVGGMLGVVLTGVFEIGRAHV